MDKIVEATIFRHWKTGSTGKPAEAQWGSDKNREGNDIQAHRDGIAQNQW